MSSTAPKVETVFVIPEDECRSLTETIYLLSSPRNAERLRNSLNEVIAKKAKPHDLDRG